ncbi:DUF3606 domain-containing protein [Mesorhizobium sp. M2A.F.Ca.ET.037.01.1.1]|nr:DUF3606 domain-containing protein [Mesorhizobium sp. M2A.F.Ca.ET.046.03.2.1]RUX09560.1 DUF3606 domain-containing protein [Mesorhizobium sp. M2A.F.Ca.ET.037.01.1.1]RUY13338.1 DUF3606 domain-containing protein [Mesorhizobium sp. M2A.F.Ca.ET.040.01.1.1]RVC71211.1 DUF3606 domain-containing protein [Mesorhizobium sp. M00.F.Ca.ET.038.03.1.1]RVC74954.1 DUF3606 domain-containing protein [Mesorhizobium sp. M2A.F.Ca.ET.046.02.1.1]RWA92943.1 MAG: DUF3606 domain-containing protein [Mesorhizobium sp.]R
MRPRMNIFNFGSDSADNDVRHANRISTSDVDQLAYFAAVNGITEQQARDLIQRHGDNLAVLVNEARKLRELG